MSHGAIVFRLHYFNPTFQQSENSQNMEAMHSVSSLNLPGSQGSLFFGLKKPSTNTADVVTELAVEITSQLDVVAVNSNLFSNAEGRW